MNVARQSAQALRPPVVLYENVGNSEPEPAAETLMVHFQTVSGERSVTTVREEPTSIQRACEPVGSSTSDRLRGSDQLSTLSDRVRLRIQDHPPVYNFPAEALIGLVTRQERATRAHQLPTCHRIGRLEVFPPEYHEIYPNGPPAQYTPQYTPPSYGEAIRAVGSRDWSIAAVYGPFIWPTMPFSYDDPPNWEYRRPE